MDLTEEVLKSTRTSQTSDLLVAVTLILFLGNPLYHSSVGVWNSDSLVLFRCHCIAPGSSVSGWLAGLVLRFDKLLRSSAGIIDSKAAGDSCDQSIPEVWLDQGVPEPLRQSVSRVTLSPCPVLPRRQSEQAHCASLESPPHAVVRPCGRLRN